MRGSFLILTALVGLSQACKPMGARRNEAEGDPEIRGLGSELNSSAQGGVSFEITVLHQVFDPQGEIVLNLFSAQDRKILSDWEKRSGQCREIMSADGRQAWDCPDQATMAPPPKVGESFKSTGAMMTRPWVIESRTLSPQGFYEILITGVSRDRCNSVIANLKGQAKTGPNVLKMQKFTETMMGCPALTQSEGYSPIED